MTVLVRYTDDPVADHLATYVSDVMASHGHAPQPDFLHGLAREFESVDPGKGLDGMRALLLALGKAVEETMGEYL